MVRMLDVGIHRPGFADCENRGPWDNTRLPRGIVWASKHDGLRALDRATVSLKPHPFERQSLYNITQQ